MKRITTLGLALGAAIVLAGSAHAQIKMGVAGPLTGPNAAFGAQLKNGTDQAVEDVNAAGGIMGQKITVSYGDDVSDPKQGVSVANKFAGDGIKFVIGHFNSGSTLPASLKYDGWDLKDRQSNYAHFVIGSDVKMPYAVGWGCWSGHKDFGTDGDYQERLLKHPKK